jgi:hypothetical protein
MKNKVKRHTYSTIIVLPWWYRLVPHGRTKIAYGPRKRYSRFRRPKIEAVNGYITILHSLKRLKIDSSNVATFIPVTTARFAKGSLNEGLLLIDRETEQFKETNYLPGNTSFADNVIPKDRKVPESTPPRFVKFLTNQGRRSRNDRSKENGF